MKVWQSIFEFLKGGNDCALISVVAVAGSTPREVGATIVIRGNGMFHGTIGGGNMENSSINNALGMLAEKKVKHQLNKHLLGPDMGQCCGGSVSVLIEVFTPCDIDDVEQFAVLEAAREFHTQVKISDAGLHRKVIEPATKQKLGLSLKGELLEHFGETNIPVYIFGAGHVGKALMLQMASLPFDVTWVDNRKKEFPKHAPANFRMCHFEKPEKALHDAPKNAQILILTHDHDLDFDIALTALSLRKFAYVGMIGSKTKGARFRSKFKKAGLTIPEISQLTSPIGIEGIKSKKPAAIAVSVVADFLTRLEI